MNEILKEISESLKELVKTQEEIRDIMREDLEFSKETDSRDKDVLKKLGEAGDFTKVFGNKMLEVMGAEQGVDIDEIHGLAEENEEEGAGS